MESTSECKGCRASVRLPEREIDRILTDYLRAHSDHVVDDQTYQHRLNACHACSDLQYGTTCRHCGCLVAVRAKLAGKSCPKPVAAWTEVK